MRIVMVGPFGLRPKGTMSSRALPMAKALSRRGHEVSLILPPWQTPEDSGREEVEDGVAIENIRLPPRIPLLQHLLIALRMVGAARSHSPDVVHCFKPKAYSGLTAFFLYWLKKSGLTCAALVVDEDDWEGQGGWNAIEDYGWAQRHFFAWQEEWGLRHADAVTVASRALETIVWSLGLSPRRVDYLPNGWDERTADRDRDDPVRVRERYSLGDAPVILLYTRFLAYALNRIVNIMRQVKEIEPRARLLIVGQGLHGEERQLLELARDSGMEDVVVMAGWVPTNELHHYFAAADVAIFPTDDTLINRTRCSVKLIDLLAAGVPVVADGVGQNKVYIQQGVSGLLAEPGDDADMAHKVLALLADEDRRTSLGEIAGQRMRERYSWNRLASIAEDAYRETVSRV